MQKPIVILVPTKQEIEPFMELPATEGVVVEICGVGMAEMAAAACRAIGKHAPGFLILAGIAGAYPGSKFDVGDVAIVETERVADLGALHPKGFLPMYTKTYGCPHADRLIEFDKASGYTVSTAAAPFVIPDNTDFENMEGAAFFSVCTAAGVPFVELRAVSNPVSSDRKRWNIPLATQNLTAALVKLIETIRQQ